MSTEITKEQVNKRARILGERCAGIRSELSEISTLAGEIYTDMELYGDDEMNRSFLYASLFEIECIYMPEVPQLPEVAWNEPKMRLVK